MFKRIMGVLLLLGGLTLTVLTAVALAYAIPRNFTVSGKGLDALVELIRKYELQKHILFICLGLTVTLASLAMLLSPRRVRVAAPEAVGAAAETVEAEPIPSTPPRLMKKQPSPRLPWWAPSIPTSWAPPLPIREAATASASSPS